MGRSPDSRHAQRVVSGTRPTPLCRWQRALRPALHSQGAKRQISLLPHIFIPSDPPRRSERSHFPEASTQQEFRHEDYRPTHSCTRHCSGAHFLRPDRGPGSHPGESATVGAGDPIEDWSVRDVGAVLTLSPGSIASRLGVYTGATLNMTGATLDASNNFYAAVVTSATANISSSTLRNDRSAGLGITNGPLPSGPTYDPSTVNVADSTISGRGMGAYILGSSLDISNSHVDSTGSGAAGWPADLATGWLCSPTRTSASPMAR